MAAVYIERFSDVLSARGDVTILERTRDGWRVTRGITLWIS